VIFIRPMTTASPQVRRANIEDLPQLVLLWKREQFDVADLEKRFKEFQVVDDAAGGLAGAVGFQVVGHEGCLHSEVFARHEQADGLRTLFLERAHVIAKNHGLFRIWTQFTTPFWNQCGLRYAGAEELAKLPAGFAGDARPWRFEQLREETSGAPSVDKEFAMFREMERERTERVMRQAKKLKVVAVVIVLAVVGVFAVGIMAWFKTRRNPR
jgi:N-acetylglutamate synthase-like GNAT family acetyltransferase